MSEVIPSAQVVDMVVVDAFTKGSGLILTFGGMVNVILSGWCRRCRWQLSQFDGSYEARPTTASTASSPVVLFTE